MTETTLEDFSCEMICIYDEELYSVRDNGAVLRHSRVGKRLRSTDDQWTFGKPNNKNGYMYISQVRIHRIVATAFHGESLTSKHIVDHIDTNRQNNRPENLRWLTRLENALLNPITVKRIELICGSIESFLEDPSKLRDGRLNPNFEWMRRVSPDEAKISLERMHLWAKSDKTSSGGGSLGEWVFKPSFTQKPSLETPRKVLTPPVAFRERVLSQSSSLIDKLHGDETGLFDGPNEKVPSKSGNESLLIGSGLNNCDPVGISAWKAPDLVMAKTPGAAQRKWRTPTEFPCCPQKREEEAIAAYATKLTVGAVFSRNYFSTSMVLEAAVVDEGQSLCVMCEKAEKDAIKPWSIARVTIEDFLYVHTSISTFFTKEGAEKAFFLARGLEWTGGDSIGDYC